MQRGEEKEGLGKEMRGEEGKREGREAGETESEEKRELGEVLMQEKEENVNLGYEGREGQAVHRRE